MKMICPHCGNDEKFIAHQRVVIEVIVDPNGYFEDNTEKLVVLDSERPYGPFTCAKCLDELGYPPLVKF